MTPNPMIKLIVKIIGISILIVWVCSCSANYHLKRSKYHLEKAKSKGYVSLVDTVYKTVPIAIPEARHDTTFYDVGDTVIITKDRLKTIYKRDTITNEVYIESICEADTIYKEVPVTVQETVYIEKGLTDILYDQFGLTKWWQKILFWLSIPLIIVILVLIRYLFK